MCPVVLTGNDLIILLGMLIFRCLRKVSLVIIGMVFGPKRRRTSSFRRREDGFSYLDLGNENVVDPRKKRVGRGIHKFARNSREH